MFKSDEPIMNPTGRVDTNPVNPKKMSLTEAMKYKNAHPDADVSTLI